MNLKVKWLRYILLEKHKVRLYRLYIGRLKKTPEENSPVLFPVLLSDSNKISLSGRSANELYWKYFNALWINQIKINSFS